ncbi:hypothetical protein CsSME_00018960 [Camellia sinensis var. sinensis]
MLTDKVTINLNVLHPLMEDSVVGNLNSTVVVIVKKGRRRLRDTQIKQETTKPNNLSSSMSHARYLTSTVERATTNCFLLFQEIKESLRNIQKLDVDLRSVTSPA